MNEAESESGLGPSEAVGATPAGSPSPGRFLRLLVAEDETIAALYLEQVLADLGHDVLDVVGSEPAAIEAAGRRRPDLVLMDIHLANGTDGIRAAAAIRARYGIPSAFVTAHGDAATRERIRGAGPLGLLTKPYSSEQVRDFLEGVAKHLRVSRG